MPATLRRAAPAGALAALLAAWPAPAAAAGPAAVNPARHPVTVRVPAGAGEGVVLRVLGPSGAVVALLTPAPGAPPAALRWRGGRGPGGAGAPLPDGRYRLELLDAAGAPLAPAREVILDRTPPRVAARSEGGPVPRVRVRLRDGRAGRARVRLVVESLSGQPVAAGRWVPAGRALPLPPGAARSGRVGPVRVVVHARDAAGNAAAADPVVVVLSGAPGAARVVRRVATRRPVVALTVDDGYNGSALASMLGTVERLRAPVTFCLNGSAVAAYPGALRARLQAAARRGLALPCEHGWSHGTGAGTSEAAARADLGRTAVSAAFGLSARPFYRPPYGAYGSGILRAAGALGYRWVMLWDIDTNDWQRRSPAAITAQVLREARRGSIVLMHTLPQSAAALPGIVAGLRARGLEPVDLGELLAAGTPTR